MINDALQLLRREVLQKHHVNKNKYLSIYSIFTYIHFTLCTPQVSATLHYQITVGQFLEPTCYFNRERQPILRIVTSQQVHNPKHSLIMATITVKYHSHSTHQPIRKQYLIWKLQQPSWHVTFPYIHYDVTFLSMTTPLATVRACSRHLQPRIYSTLFSSMTNTTDGIYLNPIFSYWMALPSPSPFTLPLLSLTYINRQQRAIHASRAAARLGAHAVRPSSFGRGPPKIIYGGPFIPPAQNTYGWAPSLPYPTTPLTLRSPKPNYGQVTPKGPTLGCAFCTRILGPWQVTPNTRKLGGGAISGNSHFGPLGVNCPFFQFWTPEYQRNTWTTLTLLIPNLSTANPPILGQS